MVLSIMRKSKQFWQILKTSYKIKEESSESWRTFSGVHRPSVQSPILHSLSSSGYPGAMSGKSTPNRIKISDKFSNPRGEKNESQGTSNFRTKCTELLPGNEQ